MTFRPRYWIAVALAVGLAAGAPAPGRAEGMLITKVDTTNPDGSTSQLLFQGHLDGSTLTGQLYLGAGIANVSGSLGSNGDVTGVVSDVEGVQLGTFAGAVSATGQLTGAYVANQNGWGFSAPAEKLTEGGS